MALGYNLGRPDNVTPYLEGLAREQQSIKGWRKVLGDAGLLLAELAGVKGAQAYRNRLDDVRHDIDRALLGSDMAVLRNSTSTAELALALAEADRLLPGKVWLVGRGRALVGRAEFGLAVFEHSADEDPLAEAWADDPRLCVQIVVEKLRDRTPAAGTTAGRGQP